MEVVAKCCLVSEVQAMTGRLLEVVSECEAFIEYLVTNLVFIEYLSKSDFTNTQVA